MVSKASQFRERFNPKSYTLSTGLEVLVQPVDVSALIFSGEIDLPNNLLGAMQQEGYFDADGQGLQKQIEKDIQEEKEALKKYLAWYDVMIRQSLHTPRIVDVDNGNDDEILIDWLTFQEKQEIVDFVNSISEALGRFPDESQEGVESLSSDESAESEAE